MKKCVFTMLLTLCLALTGCAARADDTPHRRTVFAMDTVMNLTAYGANGEAALSAAEQELYRLDALLARGIEGSAVYALNHGTATPDPELSALLDEAGKIANATGGAFDPYLGAVLDLWGFGSGAGENRVPTAAELSDAGPLLDLGGIAKGYAGQRVRAQLLENGVKSAVIDLGGDVALLGAKPNGAPWRIAIKDPADESAYLGILETAGDVYIATSGVYERYFEENGMRYHHIIDPATGYPADSGVVSATAICENGVWADALATACCVVGAEKALGLRESLAGTMDVELILVTADGRALYTYNGFTPGTSGVYNYSLVVDKGEQHG